MAKALPLRSEVPEELTWDIKKIFTNDESCRRVLKEIREEAENFEEQYKGRIKKGYTEEVGQAIKEYEKLITRLNGAVTYTFLRIGTDMGDSAAVALQAEARQVAAEFSAKLQFFNDELSGLEGKKLSKVAEENPQYATFLKDIQAWQKHMLKPKTEVALSKLSPVLELPNEVYEISKAVDMYFPDFEVNGESYPMSYVLYESHYCEEQDTDVRRAAFKAFSNSLKNYHNVNASIYNAQVQKEKIISELRGFNSVFDYLLFHQKVDREQYDRHLDITMEKLGPVMRRWAKLLQKQYNLDEMHYSDLKLVLDPSKRPQISIEESKAYINDAMATMGEEYREMVMQAFPERWIDFARNKGKSTGGFCTSVYKIQPYILLNWNDSFSELYTLAHELGHAAQGLLTDANNTPLEANFTWYDVESPSTFHEMLLSYSMLKKAKEANDKEQEATVYSAMIENTYYHNFVTHFLEAYYQREVYRRVDKGENLQANDFDQIFRETLEKFWGDAVILDEGADLTWMRQPHYYNGLYSYTYSASLVISTEMFRRLREEGEGVVEDWRKFLSTGGPMAPVEHAAIAKIDISNAEALERTIGFIESIIANLEEIYA